MGFFNPSDWSKGREPMPLVAQCGKCGLFAKCKSPVMKVDGQGRKKILILAEAPGWNEDNVGRPLVGNAGAELHGLVRDLGFDMRQDCWLTNAVLCRPSFPSGDNRTPTNEEVGYCRPNLRQTLETLKPDVVIPLGVIAVKSLMPLAWKDDPSEYADDSMARWAGWVIPSQKLNCWIAPTYHPSFVLRNKDYNRATTTIVRDHLKAAFECESKPWDGPQDWSTRVDAEMDPVKAARKVYQLCSRATSNKSFVTFDYETNRLKPDHPDAKILCCSVSDGAVSVAFPWQGLVVDLMRRMLSSEKVKKAGANIKFEHRWTWRVLGCEVKNWVYDTMLGTHALNPVRGICGLKFQAFVRLGVPFYASHLETLMGDRDLGGNAPNELHKANIRDLLTYCGQDSLLEWILADIQMRELGLL